jgi:hypothetical protein
MTVTPGNDVPPGADDGGRDGGDDIRDPLASWGRTARLCVLRLAQGAAVAVPPLLWALRR